MVLFVAGAIFGEVGVILEWYILWQVQYLVKSE